jgi:hypothetical protein
MVFSTWRKAGEATCRRFKCVDAKSEIQKDRVGRLPFCSEAVGLVDDDCRATLQPHAG